MLSEFRVHVESREGGQLLDGEIVLIVRGTLLYKSEHTFGERTRVRLHMTDAKPEESLEELAEFEIQHSASEENRALVDSLLLTATVSGETLGSPNLPANGQVIRIINSRRRSMYDGQICQLVAGHADISVERDWAVTSTPVSH